MSRGRPVEVGRPSEEWRCVIGYEGLYDVSSLGRVRSRHGGGLRLMAPVRQRQGYLSVVLTQNGERKRHSIHRLVCRAFHGEPFEGAQCAHWDGAYDNNRAENLRWATRSENTLDSVRHGTFKGEAVGIGQSGEAHLKAKLTVEQVREIRASKMGHKPIARIYGVSDRQIRRIRKGVEWQTA